ncbi:MAG: hypothetical protein SWJ54_13100 [Cyanobacteriota bacterium]|nr:hypothetical protein [Cyanobacteriota bacterium]
MSQEQSKTVQNFFLNEFNQALEEEDLDFTETLGKTISPNFLPKNATEAYIFYKQNVEEADWGKVRLYQADIENINIYIIYVSTDGDDGWLEIYNAQDQGLGFGRYDFETLLWSEKEKIRAEV